jgi:DNA-binding transcriptional MocR family regulator
MLQHLAAFPEGVTSTKPEGGLFIWTELPEEIDAAELLNAAIEQKVAFVPGTHFYAFGGHTNTLRLNFSCSTLSQIDQGMSVLKNLVERELKM